MFFPALGLRSELRLSLVAVRRGHSLVVVHGLLIVVAPHVAEHGLQGLGASVVAARGLSGCGSWALEHRFNSLVHSHMALFQLRDSTCGRQILYH